MVIIKLRGVCCVESDNRIVRFSLGDMLFEYDKEKNKINQEKHGISFPIAARVFFDYDRIEMFDDKHSLEEARYNTIGDVSAGTIIGSLDHDNGVSGDILFVAYTERAMTSQDGKNVEVTRIISARLATSFERGIYYGKYN